jgi:hypothetical protein
LSKEIVGTIANEGGIDGKLIGQINLFDDLQHGRATRAAARGARDTETDAGAPVAAEDPPRQAGGGEKRCSAAGRQRR